MIALAALRIQDVVAEAKPAWTRLPAKAERMQGTRSTRFEQVHRVSVALGFKELPDGADLHEPRGLELYVFDILEKFESRGVALGPQLLEVALETEVASVEHVGVDVAPDFGEVRDLADVAVEV